MKTNKVLGMPTARGVILRRSPYPVKETIDQLQAYLQEHDVTIYARIDQQSEAERAGLQIGALQFILFGNPKVGAPVMAKNPLVALDLPLKIIAFEDDQHVVWIAYKEGDYITKRYSLDVEQHSPFELDDLIEKLFKTSPWGEETDVNG